MQLKLTGFGPSMECFKVLSATNIFFLPINTQSTVMSNDIKVLS